MRPESKRRLFQIGSRWMAPAGIRSLSSPPEASYPSLASPERWTMPLWASSATEEDRLLSGETAAPPRDDVGRLPQKAPLAASWRGATPEDAPPAEAFARASWSVLPVGGRPLVFVAFVTRSIIGIIRPLPLPKLLSVSGPAGTSLLATGRSSLDLFRASAAVLATSSAFIRASVHGLIFTAAGFLPCSAAGLFPTERNDPPTSGRATSNCRQERRGKDSWRVIYCNHLLEQARREEEEEPGGPRGTAEEGCTRRRHGGSW